ncbi:MAG: hypothetical protein B7Z25_01760 [Aerococcus viridans]|nr:MAG: hypothetical protein B7Z25_01760 [Aerococcus viridans]
MSINKDSQKAPDLRFKGFTDDWEQRKLSDHADILPGGTPKTSITQYWEPKQIPWMSSGEVNNRRINKTKDMISEEGLNNSSARWVKMNSVLIALAGQGKTRGTVAINNIPLTTNQSIAAIVPNNKLHFEFIYHNLFKRYDELRMISSGDGTRGGLNKKIVSDIIINSPSINEQISIGTFLRKLDNTITLHQRKLDQLNQLKEALLQQMFPGKGETVPKLRFAGFEGDWEERKLKDVSDMYDNLRVPVTASDRIAGETPYYGANGIQDYVKDYTHIGEFVLIAEDGANDLVNYPVHYVTGEVWVNNHAHVVSGIEGQLDNLFLVSRLKSMNLTPWLVGGGRAKLNGDVLKKLPIIIPHLEEQQKIGSFFKHLDNTIILYQGKLDQLQNMKQVLLESMFI